jgi:hypothetical protein
MADAQRIDPREIRKEKQNDLTSESLPSIAAGLSWMFGVVSIPLLLAPPSSLITGMLAIIFGHVAKSKIRNRAELGGESTATNGLLMGYLSLFAALALLPSMRMQSTVTQGVLNSFRGKTIAKAGSSFETVERSFLDSSATATGNNKEARELATELNSALNAKRAEFFDGKNPLPIRTLCQISDQGLCVIAMVPDMADFDKLATTAMLNLVWKQSQKLAFGKITPGDEVAVAVRDRIRYHSMEFGRGTKSPDRIAQPDTAFIDSTMLEPFFESNQPEAEPAKGNDDEERQ